MLASKNISDLGALKPPLLIFGGAYSNLQALKAVKSWAEQHKFTQQQCLFTGDMVAYCANPKEVVDIIQQWGIPLIAGNVETALAEDAASCGCGFTPGSNCDTLSNQWFPFAQNAITSPQRQWFQHLPDQLTFTLNRLKVALIHGAATDQSKFLFASHNNARFETEFKATGADLIIAGHAGIPFTKIMERSVTCPPAIWHNSGAIGMPANDGTKTCWFSVLDVQNDELQIHPIKLKYNADSAAKAMATAGQNSPYAKSLITGLWPSIDILPEKEKAALGRPLSLKTLTIPLS